MDMTAHNLSNLVQSYEARKTAIHSMLVFKGINLIWTGLLSPKCIVCGNFGHVSSGCSNNKKTFGLDFKKRFLCSNLDKRHLALIYAKKQAPVFRFVSFGDMTWAFVISGSPKNLSFTLFVETNMDIGPVSSSMPEIAILASRVSVLKCSFKNVFDQIANILCKLNRLLAVSSVSFVVSPTPEHNSVLDMAVDTPLFVSPMPSVVTTVTHDISPSGSRVLTVKVDGLEASFLAWKITTCNVRGMNVPAKQEDIISVKSWITNKFSGVRVFTLGLNAGFLGTGIILIMNKNLAKHVSKIFEIPNRLLMVHLLFKNKQSVSVLGLYAETGLVNSFIARTCNKSIFVILGGDFNENGNKHSSSFSKCVDLGLVNALINSLYIKASTWSNSRDIEKTIDFVFVLQSLSNALINDSVQITIGLGGILNPVLRAICKWYRNVSHKNFAMFSNKFADFHCLSDLDGMWCVIHKAVCFSANKVFSKTWFKDFDGGYTKCFSHFHRLELLVSKLVKASYSMLSNKFVSLLDIWISLDSVNASAVKFFFLLGSHFDAIRSALAKIRKYYCSLKMMELKCAQNSQIKLAINKRIENFRLNKSQTIRSVLERPFHKVTLDYLVVNEDFILEPGLVKFYIDRIMKRWTRKCMVVGDYVFNDVFSNIMHPIETDEFFGVVLDLSDNKAASLSGISNKLWKHCDGSVLNLLLVLLNFYLVCKATAHKILSKILSNRISLVCSKYDVLHDDNFSVFKSTTTQFPIFAIGSVVEDALEKNCKLWLVLQDMRKAYDSVGWKHLRRSLVRIKIVITDFGLTNGYSVCDDLDQREAMCGYRLNSHYVTKSGHVNSQNSFTSFFATVGSSQVATQYILNIASEFFRLSDISINNNKTIAIPINCRIAVPFLSISNAPISIVKKGVSYHYLGVFLFSDELFKPSLAKAHSDLGLPLNFSNDVLYHSSFYDLKTFKQIQAENKVAVVACFINSVGILGQLFMHRSHDLQVSSWHPVHPLCFLVCISVNLLNNFLAGVVRVFLDFDLSLGNLVCNAFHFWNGISLSEILGKSMYFRCLPSLCCYGIAFVEQLQCQNGAFAVAVQHFHVAGSFNVGSFPLVATSVKDILNSHEFRSVRNQLSGLSVSDFSVYMDGSLCGLGSINMKTGAAAFFEDINLGLGVEVFGMVFSTLAELQAIALAFECMSSLSSVHLFSDSQAALDVYKSKLSLLAPDF
ncbi:hypothetical protein G9A89_012066 [Geosiphon pyriformis]|nr:hypothetical protein G9A89_012066 [Geosiphon pyriformis]